MKSQKRFLTVPGMAKAVGQRMKNDDSKDLDGVGRIGAEGGAFPNLKAMRGARDSGGTS